MYEVEQKFRLDDFANIEERLRELGASIQSAVTQSDLYFAHPARNFAVTDEALRIRRVELANWITYKGPRIDTTTKTRRELELPLPDGNHISSGFAELLQSLGFLPVAQVCKHRRQADVCWQNRTVEVVLDDVQDLGRFVELELSADDDTVDAARSCLASLATRLGLSAVERRSYLELLLEQRQMS